MKIPQVFTLIRPYGYYLLTAYYLNMPGGEKKMKKMLKKKLEEVL